MSTFIRRYHHLVIIVLLLILVSCSKTNIKNGVTQDSQINTGSKIESDVETKSTNAESLNNYHVENYPDKKNEKLSNDVILNSKLISDPNSWIKSVTPTDTEAKAEQTSSIRIVFKQDMDEKYLNSDNIIVCESKHSREISELFNYIYDKKTRTLSIEFKTKGNSYGTENGVLIYVLKTIKNTSGKEMGINVKFGFST